MFNNKFWRKIGFKDKQIKGQKKTLKNSLNLLCSDGFLTLLDEELEDVHERKKLAKCHIYNFTVR